MNIQSVYDATAARKNFFRITDVVHLEKKEIEVQKNGLPWVKIVPLDDEDDRRKRQVAAIKSAAGSIPDLDADKFIRDIYRSRKEAPYKRRQREKWYREFAKA